MTTTHLAVWIVLDAFLLNVAHKFTGFFSNDFMILL
jgi:hypothetical protein